MLLETIDTGDALTARMSDLSRPVVLWAGTGSGYSLVLESASDPDAVTWTRIPPAELPPGTDLVIMWSMATDDEVAQVNALTGSTLARLDIRNLSTRLPDYPAALWIHRPADD